MDFFRRRATQAELLEGERQMLMEQERLKSEDLEEQPKEAAEGSQNAEERLEEMIAKEVAEERRSAVEAGAIEQVRTPVRDEDERKKLWPGGPSEAPAQKGPVTPIPLFNEDQIRRLEELERQAPMLMKKESELKRPGWLSDEELRKQEVESQQEAEKQQLRKGLRLRTEDSGALVRRVQEGMLN